MANEEHLKILGQGVKVWNKWRKDNPEIFPNLANADLTAENFAGADFTNTNFVSASLSYVDFNKADLTESDLTNATLDNTNFQRAKIVNANLTLADLSGANLKEANISSTTFDETDVFGAVFDNAVMAFTRLVNIDLSRAKGLESVGHPFPSSIGIDTLYQSAGNIPESFLRGCGIPDDFITFIPSHFGIQRAIQFYSCFISYSTKDEEFARRLYSKMRDEKLRVWFAPEDVKGGQKLHEQIERAIQFHDRLLIILSEESMKSEWVMTEIRKARTTEIEQNRRKLFPIRLADFETIKGWKCFDGDSGKDLAVELREYYIPDFSNWKDHDSFEKEFAKLLRDLRAEEEKQARKLKN